MKTLFPHLLNKTFVYEKLNGETRTFEILDITTSGTSPKGDHYIRAQVRDIDNGGIVCDRTLHTGGLIDPSDHLKRVTNKLDETNKKAKANLIESSPEWKALNESVKKLESLSIFDK